jgi:hypothetical protein
MANLPFVNDRLFVVIALGTKGRKSIWIRLLELGVFYFILGAFTYFLESMSGERFTQNWEFYAISACMFVVLGFPGFVLKYLRK